MLYGLAGPFLADFASLKDFLPFVLDTGSSVKATLVRKFAEQGSKLVFGGVGSLGFTTGSILLLELSREVVTRTISILVPASSCNSSLALSPEPPSAVRRSSIPGVIISRFLIVSAYARPDLLPALPSRINLGSSFDSRDCSVSQ
jgi:hypothetical protein